MEIMNKCIVDDKKIKSFLSNISRLGIELAFMDEVETVQRADEIMEKIIFMRENLALLRRNGLLDNQRFLAYDEHLQRYYFWTSEIKLESVK